MKRFNQKKAAHLITFFLLEFWYILQSFQPWWIKLVRGAMKCLLTRKVPTISHKVWRYT